jgi:hypothetical protein
MEFRLDSQRPFLFGTPAVKGFAATLVMGFLMKAS